MDKFAALRAFVAVVEEEGFASAARAMGQSRSAVNRMVILLEDELGVQLLNRTTRQISPTANGAAFYEQAKSILDALESAEQDARKTQSEATGQLRINAPMSFGTMHLGPAIADFMARHPNLRIELHLNDRIVDIIEEGYDLAIRISEPREDTLLVDFRISEMRLVICAAPAYLAQHGEPRHASELKHRPCLHYGHLPGANLWRLAGPRFRGGVHVNAVLCSNNGQVLRDAAVHGMGIALLPTFIVGRELQAGRLVTILNDYAPPKVMLTAIYPPTRHLSVKIRLFTDFLVERFGGRPYWDLVE